GAPHAHGTVNAAAPVVGVAGLVPVGPVVVVGGGFELLMPAGRWHHLPVGRGEHRLRAHAHLAAGTRALQLTLGAVSPWHAAFGARASLPLTEDLELLAAGFTAPGIARPTRQGGWRPSGAHALQLGLSTRWGRVPLTAPAAGSR